MMKQFRAIETAWYSGDLRLVAAIQQSIVSSPSAWIPHRYKQADIVAYCCFLLGLRSWNQFQRERALSELRRVVDVRHEVGVRIIESATQAAVLAGASGRQSRLLVQPHQQR